MNKKKYGIGLATAVRGLSRYWMKGRDCKNQATALYWYPLVGAFLAIMAVLPIVAVNLVIFKSIYCLNPDARFLESAIFVALLAYGSRGFHLDGFADTFDGFGGGYTKDRVMEIMKDSRVGSFGATALICLLIIKTAALATIFEYNLLLVIPIVMLSRASLTLQCYISNYAKDAGLAKELCDGSNVRHIFSNLAFLLVPFYFLIVSGYFDIAIAMFMVMIISTIAVHHISYKKLGGITGDILGCTAEAVEMCISIAVAFMLLS
jgi:adenosylcobinamide-GDP ribazoletransferase